MVIINGIGRLYGCVAPSVIHNQLAASAPKWFQIGIGGVQNGSFFVVCNLCVAIEVKGLEVPGRIIKHDVSKEICCEKKYQAPAGRAAGDPERPASRPAFASGNKAGKELLTPRIFRA